MFRLIGRERGEKRSSHPSHQIKLGLKKPCSPFSVTASNYPKQTLRCTTVTNDFETAKLVSPQCKVTARKKIVKIDDTRRDFSMVIEVLTEWECPQLCDITARPPVRGEKMGFNDASCHRETQDVNKNPTKAPGRKVNGNKCENTFSIVSRAQPVAANGFTEKNTNMTSTLRKPAHERSTRSWFRPFPAKPVGIAALNLRVCGMVFPNTHAENQT